MHAYILITNPSLASQVEFYFSASNLPRDNFLRDKVEHDPEGFVDIALLCTFTRMAALLSSNSKAADEIDSSVIEAVADALSESDLVILSEDKKRLKSAITLSTPTEVAKEVDARSLFAAPFPYDTSLDSLVGFFSNIGSVNCVRMRRHAASKDFRGSVFIEFGSIEEAERVKTLSLEFEGAPLRLEWKREYMKKKEEERHARPNSLSNTINSVKQAEAEQPQSEAEAPDVEVPTYEEGCIVEFDFADVEFASAPTYGLIKDSFGGKSAGLAFVDYESGDKIGHARFMSSVQAQKALEQCSEGKLQLAGYEARARLLEGDEEKDHMKKVAAGKAKAAQEARHNGSTKRSSRGGGRGRAKRGRH